MATTAAPREVVNSDVRRTDFYVRPSFRQRPGYRKDPLAALGNLVLRIAIGVVLGLLLYCMAATVWDIFTQLIPAETTWINTHIPTLARHAIRDGVLDKFFALLGVAIMFVKPAKDVKAEGDPKGIFRLACLLRVPNKYQKDETTPRQFVFGLPSIYLFASLGLAAGVVLLYFWNQLYTGFGHFGRLDGDIHHLSVVALTIPVVSILWSVVISSIPKFVPSFLGVMFFGRVPSNRLTRDVQFLFVKLLVERNVRLPWWVPANIKDLAGDLEYERARYGMIVNGPDELLPWAFGLGALGLLMSGFGICVVYYLAPLFVHK